MATVDGLMTVATRATSESNQIAGLMIMDRQAVAGMMRMNDTAHATTALAQATGRMLVNFADTAGLMIADSNE